MSEVELTLNGKQIKADSSKTILEVAKDNGIEIPTLCYIGPDLCHDRIAGRTQTY